MSDLAAHIQAQLGTTPIRTLSGTELHRELVKLRAVRTRLLPAARAAKAPVAAAPVLTPIPARAFKAVPLEKGSIFSRRAPVMSPLPVASGEAVRPEKVPGPAGFTAAERAHAERTAALAAGVSVQLYEAYSLRFKLLEAEAAARARKSGGPQIRRSGDEGLSVRKGGAEEPVYRRACAYPDAPGSWIRLTGTRIERSASAAGKEYERQG